MRRVLLTLSGLLFMTSAGAASFDCAKAQSTYEKLVCNDLHLGISDESMSDSYHQVLALTPIAERKSVIVNQRQWLASISKDIQEKTTKSIPVEEIKKWLGGALDARALELKNQIVIGRPVILDGQTSIKEVCSGVLSDHNIAKASDAQSSDQGEAPTPSDDEYILSLPKQFSSPQWDGDHANFDFENQGKPVDVYSISIEATHIVGHYYIVANPEEKNAIEDKVDNASGVNDQLDLMSDFVMVASHSIKLDHPPKFTSKLFDPSLSSVYGHGAYTRSQVFQIDRSTYLLATATNHFSPTFVIFKPTPTSLDPMCYYWIKPNTKK